MDSSAIRQSYLDFFIKKAHHKQIPAAPIVPPDDPTTLFTSSGMQQLVPYLKGETHPMGTRLVDSQPCFRAEDIEEVGDNRHTTMFEMLGNWSLGDYFKAEQLSWFWQFLTQELNLDKNYLYITLFAGDKFAPKDEESYVIWRGLGVSEDHLHYYPASKNWWSRAGEPGNMPAGEVGGPDSEVFFDFGPDHHFHENSQFAHQACHVNCDCGRYLEIGNSVFMQYEKVDNGVKALPAHNVDFGGGLERLAAASQNTPDIFQTDMFKPIIDQLVASSQKPYEGPYQPAMRVIADHLRAAVFMIAQGLEPSNKLQGYVLRRLLRRAAVKGRVLGVDLIPVFSASLPAIIQIYSQAGFIDSQVTNRVIAVVSDELVKFAKVLDIGLREIAKTDPTKIDSQFAFNLYQSYGFPFEITQDLLQEKSLPLLDQSVFDQIKAKHQTASRTASAGMFKGGLADHSETVTKLHTATHLLQKSLQTILGDFVRQEGSNITAERLRFDYHSPVTPTKEQLAQVAALINQKIKEDLPVTKSIEAKDEAIKSGAASFFKESYPDQVSVYTIGRDPKDDWFSKELCGGPHVNSTGEIGAVTIKKDQSIGANIRRIYVVLNTETSAHGNQKHPQQN